MQAPERQGCEEVLGALRSRLPPDALEALLAEGGAWDEDEAFARALGRSDPFVTPG